jgi:hypothetical protein
MPLVRRRGEMIYGMPLAEIPFDFSNRVKSIVRCYAQVKRIEQKAPASTGPIRTVQTDTNRTDRDAAPLRTNFLEISIFVIFREVLFDERLCQRQTIAFHKETLSFHSLAPA